jgi:glycosyltransferase involved in cell wall biosynthesis
MYKVSICMCTYNALPFLEKQLDSILSQTLRDFHELLIVDDCSNDHTFDVLLEYKQKDTRIRVFRNSSNLGSVASFERVLGLASGDIIVLSDQDDIWHSERLSRVCQVFDLTCARPLLVVHDAELIDENDDLLQSTFFNSRGRFNPKPFANLIKNKFIGCCMCFSSDLLRLALPFPSCISMHDQWLGQLCGFSGAIHFLPLPLVFYRRHQHNLTPLKARGFKSIILNKAKSLVTFLCAWARSGFPIGYH